MFEVYIAAITGFIGGNVFALILMRQTDDKFTEILDLANTAIEVSEDGKLTPEEASMVLKKIREVID